MHYLIALGAILLTSFTWMDKTNSLLHEDTISGAFGEQFQDKMPSEWVNNIAIGQKSYAVQYTFNEELQLKMSRLFQRYSPDYGAFVAIDMDNGAILNSISWEGKEEVPNALVTRSLFPAASVYKIVTATAAIDQSHLSADSLLSYQGKTTTLYKRNVYRSGRYKLSLRQAFAKSVNSIFGKIGLFFLTPMDLKHYAMELGFNREIDSEIPMEWSSSEIPDETNFSIAEVASGFTRKNKISPLHGALLASVIGNEGKMPKPYYIQSIENQYQAKPSFEQVRLQNTSIVELQKLMESTVRQGTAKPYFRNFFRKKYKDLVVGGKTGSLTSLEPFGKCDWFVGYAKNGHKKIAFAVLTVHKNYWKVKSAYLARQYIEYSF